MGRREHVGVAGPLAPYATGFREELADQGYAPGTVSDHLRLMAHLSRWLISQELDVADLTPTVVEQFLEARADEGYARALGLGAVVPILDHLRGLGVAPKPAPVVPDGPIEVLIERYKGYLLAKAGLPLIGAHRLRHSAATQMLRAGGSLEEVGQVLRHRGRGTTSIYAKVDRACLSALIQPWPGGVA